MVALSGGEAKVRERRMVMRDRMVEMGKSMLDLLRWPARWRKVEILLVR